MNERKDSARSTISGWIDTKSKPQTWQAEVLERVQKETCWKPSKGRPNLLDQHPAIKERILQVLANICQSSLPMNGVAAWNIVVAYLETEIPETLRLDSQSTGPFISFSAVRRFLYQDLNWIDATPQYCTTAVNLLNREIDEEGYVLGMKSWTLSRVQGWNLSYKCLTSKEAMRVFLKMAQEFQDDVAEDMDWTPPEMNDILEDREEIEEAVDGIDVDFEVAAFAASTEAVDDIQLPLGYVMESGGVTQDTSPLRVTSEPLCTVQQCTYYLTHYQ